MQLRKLVKTGAISVLLLALGTGWNAAAQRKSSHAVAPVATTATTDSAPVPLLATGHPVDWWFVFKFNAASFPGCAGGAQRTNLFGGKVQTGKEYAYGQQYAYASNENDTLQSGAGCLGDTTTDPVGATFNEIYNGTYHYAVWNDQFYGDPKANEDAPWGHSKGILAWDDSGAGVVMQVSTPSWPGAGSAGHPRGQVEGNTLGSVKDDDVEVSQHFFALKLSAADVLAVATALQNASVVTDPTKLQLVSNGGPANIAGIVSKLGVEVKNTTVITANLSSGVELISKPSDLHVPPWQMVSSELGGVPLRVANWWADPVIPTTTASSNVGCWDPSLKTPPGAVDIATTGTWAGKTIGLEGGEGDTFNHAKVGVSTAPGSNYSIFGDMNQQGALFLGEGTPPRTCESSQNGRGGMFFVVSDAGLHTSITALLKGASAPTTLPPASAAAKTTAKPKTAARK